MKKILLSIIATLLVSGCGTGASGGSGASKTYDLDGHKVSFITPPAPWEEKAQIEQLERDTQEFQKVGPTIGVGFQKPDYKGFYSVGMMQQNADLKRDKNGKVVSRTNIELENDQQTLDVIAMWVEKRDGERLKEEYIKVGGLNAFHMIFEVGKPEERMKGEQVHFTKDGTHYTLSMLMPAKDYSAEVGHFQEMVSSFKLESSAKAPAPAKTP